MCGDQDKEKKGKKERENTKKENRKKKQQVRTNAIGEGELLYGKDKDACRKF